MMAKWKKAACLLMLALFAVMLLPTAAMAEASGSVSLSSEGKTNAKTAFAAAKITGETVPSSWFSFEYETSTEGSYTSGSAPTGFPENVASGALADSLKGFKTVTVEGVAYTYELAYVATEGNKVADVAAHNGTIYYRAVGGNVAGVKLNDGEKIIIRYSRSHAMHAVTYTHNTTLETDKQGTFVGATTVKDGGMLEFSYTPSKYVQSYTVKVNGEQVTAVDGKYTVSNVTGDLDITVDETTKTKYTVTYSGSNTKYTLGDSNGWTTQYENNAPVKKTYTSASCSSFSFTFTSGNQWGTDSKDLNLNAVRITVAGNEYMLALPTSVGATTTTSIDGMTIQLERTANGGYSVTITDCYVDIDVFINFKDSTSVEAWFVERVGVDPLYSTDTICGSNIWDVCTNSNFIGVNDTASSNKDYTFYVKVQKGYENPVLTLVVDGTTYSSDSTTNPLSTIGVEFKKLTSPVTKGGITYTHTFNLPLKTQGQSSGGNGGGSGWPGGGSATTAKHYDWRIYLSASQKNYTYELKYDLNGGTATGIEPTVNDNGQFSVTSVVPTRDGFIFKGWTDVSTSNTPNMTAGTLHNLTDCNYAEDETGTKAVLTLYACWDPIPDTQAKYTIRVSFDGGEPIDIVEYANIGNDLRVFEDELQEKLGTSYDLDDYELDSDTPLEKPGEYIVTEDGKLVIELKYWSTVTINYEAVCKDTAATGFGSVSLTTEAVSKKDGVTPVGSTPTPGTGYAFKGWYTDAACTVPVTSGVDSTTNKLTPPKPTADITYYALFERNTTTVTVRKDVTGAMGDKTYGFTFGCSTDNITWTTSFTLKDYATNSNATHAISGVTIGSTLYFREEAVAGYSAPTIGYGSDAVPVTKTKDDKYWTWSITVADGQIMTVTNNNGTQPDTGVILDSLPYVLILALVALGAAGAVVRRRRSREDD